MAPVLEQVARDTAGKAEVFDMDIARTDTYVRFGVSGIPTLIFFKNGLEAGRLIGVVKKEKILEKLSSLA